jgi:hypothetical protein
MLVKSWEGTSSSAQAQKLYSSGEPHTTYGKVLEICCVALNSVFLIKSHERNLSYSKCRGNFHQKVTGPNVPSKLITD